MMVKVKAAIGQAYSTNTSGSTNIPTDTKKMAPNKSFTGATSFSIRSASTVSAKMEPTTKAPNAALKPDSTATTAMTKQSANDTINKVSLFRNFRFFLNICLQEILCSSSVQLLFRFLLIFVIIIEWCKEIIK